ncbi:hypothetical protein M404DRAFT_998190 [Pisolithus tinctorius Marx 270]|uniref:Uncharacterized protein n=1 Tax=Pisolithus tinctorius Marx 270 TaxID=870435 RepID=A0A0C3P363_PISTI|nr:hypothetical protein M404DRAFT_998190 [Pisolithus tinctorius Marx 270]
MDLLSTVYHCSILSVLSRLGSRLHAWIIPSKGEGVRGAFLFLCISMTFLTLRNDGVLAGIHTLPTEKGIAYWQGIALDELKVQVC